MSIADKLAELSNKVDITRPITAAELTEQHLDMLQMADDTDIATRVRLGLASDEIRVGAIDGPAIAHCVKAFNARCGR